MIFDFFYDICLHIYCLANLPKILKKWKKYKDHFAKKLGKNFPSIQRHGKTLVWIHAVSLGETRAVAPLVKKFKALPNPPLILLSTTTETGHAEGVRHIPQADFHTFLPFDFSYLIKPIIRKIKPDLLVLTETDFWYHFQTAAKKEGATLAVVNGKISEKSYKRLRKVPFIAKRLLNSIDHFYLQDHLYKDRFSQLGMDPSKLTVTGNIKLDAPIETCDGASLKKTLNLASEPILTLGSTHDPEEKIWCKALPHIWQQFPYLKVILVPRHPERFDIVANLLESERIPYSRWSHKGTFEEKKVLLVDTTGMLRNFYQISDLAFVGGSFTEKVGGHNILEPCFYGKPVLFGPHMHSQPGLVDLVLNFQSGLQVTPEQIIPTVNSLLSDPGRLQQIGSAGLHLLSASKGSLDQTFQLLFPLLQKSYP